jgi:hypothetical protein
MINSFDQAVNVQERRINAGKNGIPKAVKKWAKKDAEFILCDGMFDYDKYRQTLAAIVDQAEDRVMDDGPNPEYYDCTDPVDEYNCDFCGNSHDDCTCGDCLNCGASYCVCDQHD